MKVVRSVGLGAALLAAVALAGCKDSSSEPPAPVAATPVNPQTAGSISVRVLYQGPVPEAQPLNMASAPGCSQLHPQPVYDRSLIAGGGGLANAVVYVKSGLEGWVLSPPSQPAVIDQKGCLYEPRVTAAMVGQAVQFENGDAEAHNVHGRSKIVDAWNFMLSRQGAKRTVYFDRPEMGIPIGCDIHPWMRAFLCVLANPYFGVSDAAGQVALRNLPPGNYVIGVWHETLGSQEQPVALTPRGEAAISFTYQGK